MENQDESFKHSMNTCQSQKKFISENQQNMTSSFQNLSEKTMFYDKVPFYCFDSG